MIRQVATATTVGLIASGLMYFAFCSWHWRTAADDIRPTPSSVSSQGPVAGQSHFFQPGTVTVEGRLGHALQVRGNDGRVHLMLRASTSAPGIRTRVPTNLVLVVDRSGSMSGVRIENAKAAAAFVASSMQTGDRVSVVSYSDDTRIELGSTLVSGSNRWDITRSIESISVGGGTCISCGLEAAHQQLLAGKSEETVNRVIVLSDGQANQGITHTKGLAELALRMEQLGANLTTVGVGLDYNEELMSRIAVAGNGNHYFVENPAVLAKTLGTELRSLEQLVARRMTVHVDLAEGVELVRGYEREFAVNGRTVSVSLGDLASNSESTVLMDLRTSPGGHSMVPVASIRVAYVDLPSGGQHKMVSGSLAMGVTQDAVAAAASLDSDVAVRVEQALVNEALAEASVQMKSGDVQGARTTLRHHRERVQDQFDVYGSAGFESQLQILDTVDHDFAEAESGGAPAASRAAKKTAVTRTSLSR